MHKINVIAKISCYFERSVVTMKLRNTVTYTSLTRDKILNSFVYRTLFYVSICGSYKFLKTVRFLAHPLHMYLFYKQFCGFCTVCVHNIVGHSWTCGGKQ